jgi:hypothetical protein
MLNNTVLEAVKDGKFHLWAIDNVEEAIPLLTAIQPGKRQEDGSYPAGSMNQIILDRLTEFNRILLAANKSTSKPGENEQKEIKPEVEGNNANT